MRHFAPLALLFFTFAHCQADESSNSAEAPAKPTIQEEVNESVKDAMRNGDPRWRVDFGGDLDGSVQGEILTVVAIASSMTVVGAAMTPDRTGKAPQGVRLTVRNANSPRPSASVRLTLADGTACSDDVASRTASRLKLLDGNGKTFHAELSGALKCGAGERIEYTAKLRKQP